MTARVVCVGECLAELSQDGPGYRMEYNGDALNVAVYLARMSPAGTAAFITRIGDDPYSVAMHEGWIAEGVDCTLVETHYGAACGLAGIATDASGEEITTYWRSRSAARGLFTEGAVERRLAVIQLAEMVYLTSSTLAILPDEGRERLLHALRRARIAFDATYQPDLWESREDAALWTEAVYKRAAIIITSPQDEAALFGEAGGARDATHAEIVMKNGAEPCLVARDGVWVEVAPPNVSRIVDPRGTNDGFNAAYLHARLRDAPIAVAAQAGHILASRILAYNGTILPAALMPNLSNV